MRAAGVAPMPHRHVSRGASGLWRIGRDPDRGRGRRRARRPRLWQSTGGRRGGRTGAQPARSPWPTASSRTSCGSAPMPTSRRRRFGAGGPAARGLGPQPPPWPRQPNVARRTPTATAPTSTRCWLSRPRPGWRLIAGAALRAELHGLLFSMGDARWPNSLRHWRGAGERSAYRAARHLGLRGSRASCAWSTSASAMRARVVLVAVAPAEGQPRQRSLGASAEDGVKGLLLMQQAVAMQDTLLAQAVPRRPRRWGAIRDPARPTTREPRNAGGCPTAFRFVEEPAIRGGAQDLLSASTRPVRVAAGWPPCSWRPASWRGRRSPQNPIPVLCATCCNGHPVRRAAKCGARPVARRSRRPTGPIRSRTGRTMCQADPELLVQELPLSNLPCFGVVRASPFGEYSIETYMRRLFDHRQNTIAGPTQPIVKGDHTGRACCGMVLGGAVPGVTFTQMPFGGGSLSQGEADHSDRRAGSTPARRRPGRRSRPRAVGDRCSTWPGCCLRNLEGLHLDPATGVPCTTATRVMRPSGFARGAVDRGHPARVGRLPGRRCRGDAASAGRCCSRRTSLYAASTLV